jgi:hypothetical protein
MRLLLDAGGHADLDATLFEFMVQRDRVEKEARIDARTESAPRGGVVGAAATRRLCGAAVSVKARAKSAQHTKRSSGFLANAAARTGSSEVSSGRMSARAGTGALRWRLMTTAGLEFGYGDGTARSGQICSLLIACCWIKLC